MLLFNNICRYKSYSVEYKNIIFILKGMKLFIKKIEMIDATFKKLRIFENYNKMKKGLLYIVIYVIASYAFIIFIAWQDVDFMCPKCAWNIKIVFGIIFHYPMILLYFTDFNFVGLTWYFLQIYCYTNFTIKTSIFFRI